MCVYFTYLSFSKAKPRIQGSTRLYTRGLKLCCEYSFRGEQERTCEFEPSIRTTVRLHNIPLLQRKTHSVFYRGNSTRTNQFHNCQCKTNNYDKKYLRLQNIQSCGFCRVFAGFISVHSCFCFVTRDKIFSPKHIFLLIFTMASKEHTYAIPDSTTVSLQLLCGMDFPNTVPFSVTDQEISPMFPGGYNFQTLLSLRIFSAGIVTCETFYHGSFPQQTLIRIGIP